MERRSLQWQVGCSAGMGQKPEKMMPAQVPGAVQMDYARAENWPPFWQNLNFQQYKWMEDVYWMYRAQLDFALAADERAYLHFEGIDYYYTIQADGETLVEGEGMFSPVEVEVSRFAGRRTEICVWIWPVPKEGDIEDRNQARKSCKAAACYGWDWHPRLISAGLWGEAWLSVEKSRNIRKLEAGYRLSDDLQTCEIRAEAEVTGEGTVEIRLLDGEDTAAMAICQSRTGKAEGCLQVEKPKLWYPVGYGRQDRYVLQARLLDEQGECLSEIRKPMGFRRVRLVMNEGSWVEPVKFPKSRSAAPATLEINGRRVFAKGSNWVNAQVFPGEMTEAHFRTLLTMARDANMNILRIWGGGFVNPECFFDICDELGIMIWQEFPLSCNEYPDEDKYLAVLEKEARCIVRRLRNHPCLALWCGGNELFNNWSGMTDQHHALRLLNSVCYEEDRFTPYNATSPLFGMGHGNYVNYEEKSGEEVITVLQRSRNTAYTEFGCPGMSPEAYIKSFMSQEDFDDLRPDNPVWREHHAFGAWGEETWARRPEAEYYFGGYTDTADLCRKTALIQSICYKSMFEEMRRQWPLCAMALNWCYNEPWPTAAGNSLIAWPQQPKDAYYAVQAALRPRMASLQAERNLWRSGETFQGGVWMLNDSDKTLEEQDIRAYCQMDGAEIYLGSLHCGQVPPRENRCCGGISFEVPGDYEGLIRVWLRVNGEMDSEYTLICRKKADGPKKVMLNM